MRHFSYVASEYTVSADNNIKRLGALLYETHDGLSRLYEVSCDELDFLVAHSKKFDAVIGARMMGGGFGGCTINLVHKDEAEAFIESAKIAYKEAYPSLDLETYKVKLSDGTSKL